MRQAACCLGHGKYNDGRGARPVTAAQAEVYARFGRWPEGALALVPCHEGHSIAGKVKAVPA